MKKIEQLHIDGKQLTSDQKLKLQMIWLQRIDKLNDKLERKRLTFKQREEMRKQIYTLMENIRAIIKNK
jgi:hypothetical protein